MRGYSEVGRELWRPPGRIYGPDGELMSYWASRWSEFKRLFWKMLWGEMSSRVTLILCLISAVVLLFGGLFLGWR